MHCPKCLAAVWSEYGGVDVIRYVRAGTLDEDSRVEPSIHIFMRTKMSWIDLGKEKERGISIYEDGNYNKQREWPRASLKRREGIQKGIDRCLAEAEKRRNMEMTANN